MEDIFLKNLPFIDLHGYDRETARVAINLFVDENVFLRNKKIVIVHGKGTGVIKGLTHEILSKRKDVIKYYTDNNNDGCTVVYLVVDN